MDNETLIRAFAEINAERYDEYLNAPKMHRFSLSYRIRKRSIIRSFERGKTEYRPTSSRTIRVILFALIFTLLALTLGGFCLYFVINGFHFEVHSEYSAVHFEAEEGDKKEIREIYVIPEELGANLLEQDIIRTQVLSEYSLENKKIILNQMIPSGTLQVNTEDQSPEPIDVNGNNGFYILMNYGKESYLVWKADGYIFSVGGNLTKDEALSIAISIKKK